MYKRFFTITDPKGLATQVESLSIKKRKRQDELCTYKWRGFYVSYTQVKRTHKATADMLYKLQSIGVNVKNIISDEDRVFIFWK